MWPHARACAGVRSALGLVVLACAVGACSDKTTSVDALERQDAAAADPFSDSGFTNPDLVSVPDAGSLSPDAFFIDDPEPPYCGEDGKMRQPAPIGGTRACPEDKNREGCPCTTPGQQALCWPGQRLNRNHGVCRDGMTTCQVGFEFGHTWGRCEGYVLPVEEAMEGPNACRCFSSGLWSIANLVPCIAQDVDEKYYVYSSHEGADGYVCEGLTMTPPPVPAADWTSSTLKVDCGGRFELCYTIKAGDVASPQPGDCVLSRSCVTTWYARAGSEQKLPNLKAWSATDQACAQRFVDRGGYGEMSVLGTSTECEAVDDGQGRPYVFKRASYCSPRCAEMPDNEECRHCSASGAGDF
jgi:hypothetical protein